MNSTRLNFLMSAPISSEIISKLSGIYLPVGEEHKKIAESAWGKYNSEETTCLRAQEIGKKLVFTLVKAERKGLLRRSSSPFSSVAEFGSGNGIVSACLSHTLKMFGMTKLYAVDLYSEIWSNLIGGFSSAGIELVKLSRSISDTAIPNASLSFLWCAYSALYDNPPAVFKEMYRTLRRGGLGFVIEVGPASNFQLGMEKHIMGFNLAHEVLLEIDSGAQFEGEVERGIRTFINDTFLPRYYKYNPDSSLKEVLQTLLENMKWWLQESLLLAYPPDRIIKDNAGWRKVITQSGLRVIDIQEIPNDRGIETFLIVFQKPS